jgi:hypothetical protein
VDAGLHSVIVAFDKEVPVDLASCQLVLANVGTYIPQKVHYFAQFHQASFFQCHQDQH